MSDVEIIKRLFNVTGPDQLPPAVRQYFEEYKRLQVKAGIAGPIPEGVLIQVAMGHFASEASPPPVEQPEEEWFGFVRDSPAVNGQAPPTQAPPAADAQVQPSWMTEPRQPIPDGEDPRFNHYPQSNGESIHDRSGHFTAPPMPLTAADLVAGPCPVTFTHPRTQVLASGAAREIDGDTVKVATHSNETGQLEVVTVPLASCVK